MPVRPSFQFYPADWLNEKALKLSSFEEKGFLVDFMCIVHQGTEYGYLSLEDEPHLHKIMGISSRKCAVILSKLCQNNRIIRDEVSGKLCVLRMIRDEHNRQIHGKFGRLGGNPNLVNPPLNPPLNAKVKLKRTPSFSSSSSSSKHSHKNENVSTPAEIARDFFKNEETQSAMIMVLKDHGLPEQKLKTEIARFARYWTELNKSGTKERWELEKTFDVKRRLYTWLERNNNYQSAQRKGGVTIIS